MSLVCLCYKMAFNSQMGAGWFITETMTGHSCHWKVHLMTNAQTCALLRQDNVCIRIVAER